MTKYDETFKQALVQEYLSGPLGYRALAHKHSVSRATIQQWISRYRLHGSAGLRTKFSHYSAQFKRSVLEHMRQEELSYRQVAALFDLRGGAGVVAAWERQYHKGGLNALKPKPRGRSKKMPMTEASHPEPRPSADTRTVEDLRKENEYLRTEVAYLKKLNALVQAKKLAAQKKRG